MLTFLIMAGGSGERFWPLSTKEKPKQVLKIFSEKSLIRLTYERILPLTDDDKIFIATNEVQFSVLSNELPEIPQSRFIIEPEFRDTAAAIAYGSTIISKYFTNPTIVVLASDHLIKDEEEFRNVIKLAEQESNKNKIVTLGIKPTYPETGYGYIQVTKGIQNVPEAAIGFKEKPSLEIAKEYFASGKYLWNSGMFIFKYDVIMEAFAKYSPNHYAIINEIKELFSSNEGLKTAKLVKSKFSNFEKKSIDFAIMEHATNIMVIPSSFGWNDVGNYMAFEALLDKDTSGNISKGVRLITVDSNNNIIVSDGNYQRISLLSVNDMIVAVTKNDIFICPKSKNQEIKKIIAKL